MPAALFSVQRMAVSAMSAGVRSSWAVSNEGVTHRTVTTAAIAVCIRVISK
jgi:hypothetical protein